MFGRKKDKMTVNLQLAPALTPEQVESVKKCHEERLERERLVTAKCKAHYMVYGGIMPQHGWCLKRVPSIPKSLKLTKSQKEQLKTHIAGWLNESEWFKP